MRRPHGIRRSGRVVFVLTLAIHLVLGGHAGAEDVECLRWFLDRLGTPIGTFSGTFARWECDGIDHPEKKAEALRLCQLMQANARSLTSLAFPDEYLEFEGGYARRPDGEAFRFLRRSGVYNDAQNWFVQDGRGVLVERQTRHMSECNDPELCRHPIATDRLRHLLEANELLQGLPNVEELGEADGEVSSPILGLPLHPIRLKPGLPDAPSSRQWIGIDPADPSKGIELVQIVGMPDGRCVINILAYHRWIDAGDGQFRASEFSQIGVLRVGTIADPPAKLLALESTIDLAKAAHVRWSEPRQFERIPDRVMHPQPFEDFISYSSTDNPKGHYLSERDRGKTLYEFEDLPFHSTEGVKSVPANQASPKLEGQAPISPAGGSQGYFAPVVAGLSVLGGIVVFLLRRRRSRRLAAFLVWSIAGAAPAHSDPCGAEWRVNVSDIEAGTARVELPDWASGALPNTFAVLVTNDTAGAIEYTRIRPECWCVHSFSDRLTLLQGESVVLEFSLVAPAGVPFGTTWERALHFWKTGDPLDLPPRRSLTLAGRLLDRPILSFQLQNRISEDWRGMGIPGTITNPHTKGHAVLEGAEFAGSPCAIFVAGPAPDRRMLPATFPLDVPPEANVQVLVQPPEEALTPDGLLVLKWRTPMESWEDRIPLHRSMIASDEFVRDIVEMYEDETSGTARVRFTRRDGADFSVSPAIAVQPPFVVTALDGSGEFRDASEFRLEWLASGLAANWGTDVSTRRALNPFRIEVTLRGAPCRGMISSPAIKVAIPPKPAK